MSSEDAARTGAPVARCDGPLTVGEDGVEAMALPLQPFGLYRIDYEARGARPGYCFVDFFNKAGEQNYADNYSSVDASEAYAPQSAIFMARAEAERGTVGFRPLGGTLDVRNMRVRAIGRDDALAWMDALYAELPEVRPDLDKERWTLLPRLREALRDGRTLRVVALGDSISNDMLNGLGHLLLERDYPGTTWVPIHANGPEKSCENYRADEVLQRLVIRHRPDFFTLAGMSHAPEHARTVIDKVRKACDNVETVYFDVRVDGDPAPDQRLARLDRMRRMGEEDGFAVWDMTTPFQECLERADQPLAWFQRDDHHVNDRGKQILGRLYAAYFSGA